MLFSHFCNLLGMRLFGGCERFYSRVLSLQLVVKRGDLGVFLLHRLVERGKGCLLARLHGGERGLVFFAESIEAPAFGVGVREGFLPIGSEPGQLRLHGGNSFIPTGERLLRAGQTTRGFLVLLSQLLELGGERLGVVSPCLASDSAS